MKEYNSIDEYIDEVCKQIRAKKIHEVIANELKDHITDQKNVFIKQGIDEETATIKAIEEMGDPVSVGSQFDRIHRPKPEWSIIVLTIAMILIGLLVNIFIFKDIGSLNSSIISRLFASVSIGTALMIIIYFVDYTIIVKYPKTLLLAFSIPFLILPRLLDYFNYKYLFAQVIVLCVPLYAGLVYSLKDKEYEGLILCIFTHLLSFFIFRNYHKSYMFQFIICCVVILTIVILKGWFNINKTKALLILYIPLCLLIFLIFFTHMYIVQSILNPDPLGSGYQISIVRECIKNSRFIGSCKPFEFFNQIVYPKDITAFIPFNQGLFITYLISKYGFIVGGFIILMFVILAIRMLIVSFKQKSSLGFIVSISCTLIISLQGVIYICNNLGLSLFILSTELPFISSGTNLILNMCLIGILLSVFRNDNLVKDKIILKSKSSNLANKLFQLVLKRLNYWDDKNY